MIATALLVLALSAAPEKPNLVVLKLTPAGGLEEKLADAVTEALTVEVSKAGYFSVLSSKDVETLLGRERQRQMLGCNEESASCLSELAGALGARFVMSGSLARLGDAFQLTLQTLDSQKAQPVGRAVRISKSLPALQAQLAYAVAEATATPAPPPPSHGVPYTLMGAGAVLIAGGAVAGFDGISRERTLNQELSLGEKSPAVLRPYGDYRSEAATASLEKTGALVGLGVGAALIGLGIYLNPSEAGGGAVALVPRTDGFALVGVLP